MVLINKMLRQRDHLIDVLSTLGLHIGAIRTIIHVHIEFIDELLGDITGILAHLVGTLDDLVVNVREVTDKGTSSPL